jgi:hypothetical protein
MNWNVGYSKNVKSYNDYLALNDQRMRESSLKIKSFIFVPKWKKFLVKLSAVLILLVRLELILSLSKDQEKNEHHNPDPLQTT